MSAATAGWWRWLLGIDSIPEGAAGVRLGWEHPLPTWGWALAVAAAVALAWIGYARIQGPTTARVALGALRAAAVAWLLAVLLGPELVLPRERIEPDRVAVVVDRSASLEVRDAPAGASRDEQAREVSIRLADALRADERAHEVRWFGFHADAFPLEVAEVDGPILGAADGARTRLGRAIERALRDAAERPIAAVVVASDGRTDDPPDRALLRRLADEGIPLIVVPLGSAEPLGDVAVAEARAPGRAFRDDEVPVEARLSRVGRASDDPVIVRLVDSEDGTVLAEQSVPPESIGEPVVLLARAVDAGRRRWRVEVVAPSDDLVPANDSREVEVELLDRPLRVLFCDASPRWEYRYLKNLLVREPSVESSVMLLSADRDFAQEGNMPISRLPRSPEELAAYDLIVLGDVPGGFFSPEQLEMIREHVAVRGAGLVVVAGPRNVPRGWERTPLEELVPFAPPTPAVIDREVSLRATDLAARLGVVGADSLPPPDAPWGRLRWAQRIDPATLKPAAEVLAETTEGDPILLRMRYGAGQVLYLATDETWRWRYGRGETLQERFWIPLLRLLGRESVAEGEAPWRLRATPSRIALGEATRLELELGESRAMELDLASAEVSISRRGEDGSSTTIDLPRTAPGLHAASWIPDAPGEHLVEVSEPGLLRLGGRAGVVVEVTRADAEWRRPDADHALLASIAEATGGALVPPDQLEGIVDRIPNRSVVVSMPIVEPIWSSPLALLGALLLLSMEWIGRRLLRLA